MEKLSDSFRAGHAGGAPEASAGTEVCPECHGRGWKVVTDGGAGTAVRCECLKRERGGVYLARAGIPERYRRCRLSNFKTTGAPEVRKVLLAAHKKCQLYVENFFDAREQRFRESGLLFYGPPGIGKTHLAVAVMAELIESYQVHGRFVDFTALLHQIQSTFGSDSQESKHSVLQPVMSAELLVLDELGAQKPTEWVMNTLYLIMNTRYNSRLPTIFTTNYYLDGGGRPSGGDDPVSLAARISPLLVSRLYEMAQLVNMSSVERDFRRDIKQHKVGR